MTRPPPRCTAAELRSTPPGAAAAPEGSAPVVPRARRVAPRALVALAALAAAALTTACDPVAEPYCSEADSPEAGQQQIDEGSYEGAIQTYSCLLESDPATVDAYRGRAEAEILLGLYSDAYRDLYANAIAAVQPDDIIALGDEIVAGYDARLAERPDDVPALMGGSFARWSYFQYDGAFPLLEQLLSLDPESQYALLFRGSNRLFAGADVEAGQADMEAAVALDPSNAHVRYVLADAYTYALPDPPRAYSEAALALEGGLDTPRVRAILGASLDAAGDRLAAAYQVDLHIAQVTEVDVETDPLAAGSSLQVELVPHQAFLIPLEATAGETIMITTGSSSANVWDSILVLFGPDGTFVASNDDADGFFAGLDWVAPETGTYVLRVTGFEGIFTGPLEITRD